jgi:5-methylcytosine-specific restriction endonuclease McrA
MIVPSPPLGFCRWCGGKITLGKFKQRNWHDGRENEPDCLWLYQVATLSDAQRRAVFARDGGKCHDCGETPDRLSRLNPVYRSWPQVRKDDFYIHDESERSRLGGTVEWRGKYLIAAGPYCVVEFIEKHTWEADHDFPLWLVDRTKPREEIIKYWSIDNLVTRCIACHQRKTAEEAAQRAKGKRLRGLTGTGAKRKIQSRGFDKSHRQKFDGSVVARTGAARMA